MVKKYIMIITALIVVYLLISRRSVLPDAIGRVTAWFADGWKSLVTETAEVRPY